MDSTLTGDLIISFKVSIRKVYEQSHDRSSLTLVGKLARQRPYPAMFAATSILIGARCRMENAFETERIRVQAVECAAQTTSSSVSEFRQHS
jgi:hypothetical protein